MIQLFSQIIQPFARTIWSIRILPLKKNFFTSLFQQICSQFSVLNGKIFDGKTPLFSAVFSFLLHKNGFFPVLAARFFGSFFRVFIAFRNIFPRFFCYFFLYIWFLFVLLSKNQSKKSASSAEEKNFLPVLSFSASESPRPTAHFHAAAKTGAGPQSGFRPQRPAIPYMAKFHIFSCL